MFDTATFDQVTLMIGVFALIPILALTLMALMCRERSESDCFTAGN